MRWFSIAPFSLLIFLLFSSLGLSFAVASHKHYLVYLGKPRSEARQLAESSLLKKPGHTIISHFLQRKPKEGAELVYTYSKVFHGFSALLHEEDANEIANHPRVLSVIEVKTRPLATTKSWEFLGLENSNGDVSDDSMWKKTNYGEDVIIANVDTGVWPEAKIFDDEGFGPIPKRFKGICDNANDPTFHCNKKLIGARYFYAGFQKEINKTIEKSFLSPRDGGGHGTFTLAIAGGRAVPNASFPLTNITQGTVKGGAPRARVVAYKVCWPELIPPPGTSPPNEEDHSSTSICNDADVCAGIEAAIDDNVNVISASIGQSIFQHYLNDVLAISTFHALQKGIPVITAAGNDGPNLTSVRNAAPWMLTVAASSINRKEPRQKYVVLGNKSQIMAYGSSGSLIEKHPYPLTSGVAAKATTSKEDEALRCYPNTLDPTKVKGKLLFCLVDDSQKLKIIEGEARRVGAIGMFLSVDTKDGIHDPGFQLPSVGTARSLADIASAYITSTSNPVAYIEEASAGDAPLMATFSARGPTKAGPTILKPDITAPGVNIISANADMDGTQPWAVQSGTSLSAPHVAGVVALLRSMYPHWSPSAIKSAIMTTATTVNKDNIPIRWLETKEEANPFDYGAGHIVPNQAADPGLVYDLSENDYLNFLCALKFNTTAIKKFAEHIYTCPETPSLDDFNYPSITVYPFSPKHPFTISRKLKNVGKAGTYVVQVSPPPGICVDVVPKKLEFKKTGEELSFRATFKSADGSPLPTDYVFGELVWTDGQHRVRSTITILVDGPLLAHLASMDT